MPASATLVSKIKVQLKLSISRLRMVEQKDSAIAKQQRRAMAQLLEIGKEESARIRVENIIQSDIHTELLEILELYCELLLARTGLLEAKECDAGLEEAVKSIIYAAPRTEIKELHQTRLLLVEKYGKEFAQTASSNADGKVSERVLKKLQVKPPSPELVTLYLREIARTYDVDWPRGEKEREGHEADAPVPGPAPAIEDDNTDKDDRSGSVEEKVTTGTGQRQDLSTDELHRATPPRDLGPRSPVSIAPPAGTTENLSPKLKLPSPPDLKPGVARRQKPDVLGGKVPDVDELSKRFAALKK